MVMQLALAGDLEGLSRYLGYWQDQFAPDQSFALEKVALGQLSQRIYLALNHTAAG